MPENLFFLSIKAFIRFTCYFCGPKVTKSLFGPQSLLAMNLLQPFVFLVASARSFCGRLGEASSWSRAKGLPAFLSPARQ